MKFLLFIFFISINLFLIACPGSMIKYFDEEQKAKANYKPQYNTNPNTKNYQTIEEKSKLLKIDSNLTKAELRINNDSAYQNNINLELSSLDSRSFPDLVEIKLTVKDADGKYISELAPPYINKKIDYRKYWTSLLDSSNEEVNVKDFTVEEIRSKNSKPFSIVYLVDYSGSMSYESKVAVNKSITPILRSSKKDDYISFVKFRSNAFTEIPLQKSKQFLKNKTKVNISDDSISGGTNINEAFKYAFNELKKSPKTHQKLIVLISDGEDTFSQEQKDIIQKEIFENNIQVYAISIGLYSSHVLTISQSGFNVISNNNPVIFLDWIVNISGGKHYNIMYNYEFPFVFADIYLQLKNYYSLKYKAPNFNSIHKVAVSLNIDELNIKKKATEYYDKSIFKTYDPIGEVKLLNIEFESGKSIVNQKSYPILNDIISYMKQVESVSIEISGHTDNVGEEKDNLILSKQRAEAVKKYIVLNNIDKKRIKTKGFGESKPLNDNSTEENRKVNRRTEFKILKK